MIERETSKQPFIRIRQSPTNYKPHSKCKSQSQASALDGSNRKIKASDDIVEINRVKNSSFLSAPENSIKQIKDKIKGYITFNSETSAFIKPATEHLTECPRKGTQEQFRISIFRNNIKRKINLKLIEDINPERYPRLSK